jgi:hypothetical protein
MKPSKKIQQRQQLVLAMLQQPSLEKAATAAQISTATAWRINQTPEFQREYRKARREAYGQAMARLEQSSSAAVNTLLRVLTEPQHSAATRIRAAECVLNHAAKANDREELTARVEALEQARKQEHDPHA